ncbi:MAG: carboxypeptidase-like regulatory domain-containing protein [Terracidiphilus sp.]
MKLIHEIRVRAFFLVALVGLVCFGSLAYGQGTSATLTGNVTDQNGAAISGASVVLKNVDTGLALQTQTDKVGTYMFNTVPAGNYELTINAAGFVKYAQTGIILNANLNATQNVHLTVGSAKDETIKVTANAELIDTTTAELGMTINEEAVSELPFINRDPSAVALLAPGMLDGNKAGVAWQQAGFSFPNESVASSNGGRVGSTFYMLDGVSNMDTYLGSNSPTPNSDATQEFRLISNNFSAIYGFSTGGVVSMATRSGTNSWHGGLFEFMRNTDFDSGDWVTHVRSTYRRNQFGGYVGGPALKDKLFFFFNYQRTDLVGGPGSAANGTSTPTTQMMNGDFSGLIDYAQANNTDCGSGYNVPVAEQNTHCGWLLGPFQTVNGIPNQVVGGAAALDPIAIQFTNDGLPGHTAPASGTGNGTATVQNLAGGMLYASANLGNDIWNEYTGRVDYDVTPSQRLTLRSFIDKFIQPAGDTPGDVLSVINMNGWSQTFGEQMWYFNELAQHTWTMNPSTVNTFTGFWTQQSSHNGTPVLDHQGKPMCWSRYIKTITEPTCGMEGAYFGSSNGGWTEPSNEVRGTIGFSDTLIKTLGRHTLSAGIDLVHQRAVENAINYPADAIIDFGGYTNFGNNAASGSGIADWLLGYMSGFEQGAGELADIQGWLIDPYVNDEFRLKPGLTLTLGLRWDPDFAPVSVGGRGTAFVAGQQSIIYPAAPTGLIFPGDANMNAGLRPSDTAYFEPRLGVAYQPKFLPHTSFHAAFGMFTAPVAYSDYNHVVDMAPFSPAFSPANPSNTPICSNTVGGPVVACVANSGQILTGYSNFDNPWSTPSFNTPNGNPFGTGPGQIPWANPNYKPPTNSTIPGPVYEQDSFARSFREGVTQAWNASIEQQLSNVMAVLLQQRQLPASNASKPHQWQPQTGYLPVPSLHPNPGI